MFDRSVTDGVRIPPPLFTNGPPDELLVKMEERALLQESGERAPKGAELQGRFRSAEKHKPSFCRGCAEAYPLRLLLRANQRFPGDGSLLPRIRHDYDELPQ